MKLIDVMPREFSYEYVDTKAYKMKDIEVVQKYSTVDCGYDSIQVKSFPGTHKNVYVWYELVNGYAVGINENPSRGWSFPVVKVK